MADPRDTYAWKQLRRQVVREEPVCWLRLPCCTVVSTTADHVITVKQRPDLALVRSNVRGACAPCNHRRNDKTIEELSTPKTAKALDFFA